MMSEKESCAPSLDAELAIIYRFTNAEDIAARITTLSKRATEEDRKRFSSNLALFLQTLRQTQTPPAVGMIDDVYRLTFNQGPETDFPVQ